MRELTPEECELIAGGRGASYYDDEGGGDIVVTASPPPYWPPPYWPPPYYPPPPTSYPPTGGGGGTSPTVPSDNYPPDWDHQRDYNIDKLGADLARQIDGKPDSDRREYSAFVYKTADGALHQSAILPGTNQNTGNPNGGSYTTADYGIPNGATLVAEIHNHPEYYETSPGVFQSNPQSVNPDYGDIAGMQSRAGGDSQYRLYLDHNGYVSEYDYVNNSTPATGSPLDVDPNAVRGGFYPELGN